MAIFGSSSLTLSSAWLVSKTTTANIFEQRKCWLLLILIYYYYTSILLVILLVMVAAHPVDSIPQHYLNIVFFQYLVSIHSLIFSYFHVINTNLYLLPVHQKVHILNCGLFDFWGGPFWTFSTFWDILFLWLPLRIISTTLHCRYFTRKITRFFGVDSSNEDQAKTTWVERRRRMAIKKLGGVKVAAHFIMFQQWPWTIYSFEFPSNSNSRIYKQNHGFWKCK